MSMADEFRRYAEEALRGAERSETAEEKQALIGLARTWAEAAVQIGSTPVRRDKPHVQSVS
jgi:hypothetical protein